MLVLRTGHLGDTICAIPAFRLLRQVFSQSHLTLLCDRPRKRKVAARDASELSMKWVPARAHAATLKAD